MRRPEACLIWASCSAESEAGAAGFCHWCRSPSVHGFNPDQSTWTAAVLLVLEAAVNPAEVPATYLQLIGPAVVTAGHENGPVDLPCTRCVQLPLDGQV